MSRQVCGNCLCPYGDDGQCACVEDQAMTTAAGMIYLPNRWSGDTHSDKDTGCVDVEATEQLIAKQAAEIERLTTCLKRANDNHEHFEREWYLRGEVLDKSEALLLQALVLLRGAAPNGYGVGSEQEAVIDAIKQHLGDV